MKGEIQKLSPLSVGRYQSLSVASTSSGEGESRDNVGKRVMVCGMYI